MSGTPRVSSARAVLSRPSPTPMARNIEIKAKVGDIAEITRKVAAIADSGPVEIVQDDTFFNCETGRLKLRAFPDGHGELIYYRRADDPGPKESYYLICAALLPGSLRKILSQSFGQGRRIEKRRTLFLVGRTRVHLDQVKGLGEFIELEVVLRDGEPAEAGIAEAHALTRELGIDPSQLLDCAYVDLPAKAEASGRTREDVNE